MTTGRHDWAGMDSPAPKEPAAEMRVAAKALREYFLALTAEGFTEGQALQVIGHVLLANSGQS